MARNEVPVSEPLLTPAEVSARFRVDVKSVCRWAKQGKIRSVRTVGGHRRYFENEVAALLRGEVWEPPEWFQDVPGPKVRAAISPLEAPVSTLWAGAGGIPVGIQACLKREAIITVGGLVAESAADLSALGLRPPQVDEVRVALARRGLALAGDVLGEVALARSPAG